MFYPDCSQHGTGISGVRGPSWRYRNSYRSSGHILFYCSSSILILLHSERPKLYTILAFLRAIGLNLNDSSAVSSVGMHSKLVACKQ